MTQKTNLERLLQAESDIKDLRKLVLQQSQLMRKQQEWMDLAAPLVRWSIDYLTATSKPTPLTPESRDPKA